MNQSELLKKALDKAKVPCKFEVLEGAAHGGRGPPPRKMDEMVRKFFDQHLKSGKGECPPD